MAVINPYAGDTIKFPPGTPAGVMNAYYNYIVKQRSQPQPGTYENYFQPFIHDVLNPFLTNEFLNYPAAREKETFTTNEAIRLDQAKSNQLLQKQQELANFQEQMRLENERNSRALLGGAYGQASNIMMPGSIQESQPGGGTTDQFGYQDPFSDPVATAPIPETMQGELAPTGGSNMMTVSQPQKPTNLNDILRLLSGRDPIAAGLLIQEIQKNKPLYDTIDPAQSKFLKAQADIQETLSKTAARNTLLPGQVAGQEAGIGYKNAQINRLEQIAQTESGKDQIRQLAISMIERGEPQSKIDPYLAVLAGKPMTTPSSQSPYTKSMQLQIDIAKETDPVKKQLLQTALNSETSRQAQIAGAQAAARIEVTGPQAIYQRRLKDYETKMEDLAATEQIVDQIAELSRQISIPTPGDRVKGLVSRELAATTQSNSVYALFASKSGLLANLARSISGERGTLNEGDVKRIAALMPTYNDIDSVREQKLVDLYTFLTQKKSRFKSMLTSPTGNAESPSSTYLDEMESPPRGFGAPPGFTPLQ
jgi:hypothetical protein